jgi:fatty acid desaturase
MTAQVEAAKPPRIDITPLTDELKAHGLLEPRLGYYAVRITIVGVLFAAGWLAFFHIGDSWFTLPLAAFFAIMYTQVGFIGHDAGHRQVFRSSSKRKPASKRKPGSKKKFSTKKANNLLSLILGNLIIAISNWWWLRKHTKHHVRPNVTGQDDDIKPGALTFTKWEAALRGRAGQWLARNQAYLFPLMLLGEGFSLHVSSVRAILGRNDMPWKTRIVEFCLFGAHVWLYIWAVFAVLSPLRAVVFILVHQCLWGVYMGLAFEPNHVGMPTFKDGEEPDFVRLQVDTSRNVDCNWFTHLLLGGLCEQTEHHLVTNMPSCNLPAARPIVQKFCKDNGLEYTTMSLRRAYAEVFRHLDEVGSEI